MSETEKKESKLKEGEIFATEEQNQWFRNLLKENKDDLMLIIKNLESTLVDAYIDFIRKSCLIINISAQISGHEHSHVSIPGSLQWSETVASDLSNHALKEVLRVIKGKWEDVQKEGHSLEKVSRDENISKIFH
jgi:hypothetical protein